ncbi:MAG: hypothetical protein D9V44_03805 [Actinobacteria bacterium]|nr:MAG: hypothetical protein D9V44_03805 [Actinomycetota bacterium]
MTEKTRYGFTAEAWRAGKAEARDFLIARARERGTTTYSELCDAVTAIRLRPYSFGMMKFLNEVCAEEDAANGIMLASLVTRKDSGMPGDGYFKFASGLGRDACDREAFWRSEIERIYAAFPPKE